MSPLIRIIVWAIKIQVAQVATSIFISLKFFELQLWRQVNSQIAAAASVEQQDGLAVAFDWKPQQLDRVKSLYFPEDPAVTCATDVCACRVYNPSRIDLSAYCVSNPRIHFVFTTPCLLSGY
jgi:hypothetical protein